MNRVLLHLSLIRGVGPATVSRILEVVPREKLEELYSWFPKDFSDRFRFPQTFSKKISDGLSDKKILEKELNLMKESGANWLTVLSDDYPELLKHINFPPTILYWFGVHPKNFENSIAFVGSRKANRYAKYVLKRCIPEIASSGWGIVSGGACGADTMAHVEALECGSITCAVMGSGLLKPYPSSNKKLFERILRDGGTILSPFPLNSPALPGNFPARNRIISGLSRATVVVQAARKSGARITAMFALEQGREVCAIPGSIEDPLSEGCNKLILEGAVPVTSGEDILNACGYFTSKKPNSAQNSCIYTKPKDPIVTFCEMPQTFDEIMIATKHDFDDLQERLLELQLDGKLEQDFSGRWRAT